MPEIIEMQNGAKPAVEGGAVEHSEGFKNIQHTPASSAKSGVQAYKKVFTEFEWSIKDFSHHATAKAALISPAFYTEPKEDGEKVRWYLNCYVGCNSDKASPEHVSVFISNAPNMVIEHPARNWEVDVHVVRQGGYRVKKPYGANCVEITYLMKNSETLLPDNTLTFYLSFTTTYDVSKEESNATHALATETVTKGLASEFSHMLNNGKYSDVVLVSGGQKFRVHKSVLGSRSSVFDQMFKDSSEKEMAVDNISPIVLWEFLRYLYTGEIVNMDVRVEDLFVVADKYDVPLLTDICESFMIHNLTVENVSRCLVLGHNHNRPDLKGKSMLYIAHNGDQVISHPEWKKVEEKYPVLVVEAFRLVFRMPKPNAPNAIEG